MPNIGDVDQDYKLWVLLGQASDMIFEARENELREYGITAMQAEVLFAVQAIGDKTTPAQISRWTLRRPHSISGILDRMEKVGLIRKTKDLARKNQVRVSMTDKGRQAYNKSLKRKSIHRIMSALAEEERQQLWSRLETARNKALKEVGKDPKKVPFPKSL